MSLSALGNYVFLHWETTFSSVAASECFRQQLRMTLVHCCLPKHLQSLWHIPFQRRS